MSAAGRVVLASVVIGNLIYIIGAVVLMIVISAVIVLRQRKPKSVEANMESFNRGLRALAPTPTPGPPRRGGPPGGRAGSADSAARVDGRRRTVQTVAEPDTETGRERRPG